MKALLPSFVAGAAICLVSAPVQGALYVDAIGFGRTKIINSTGGSPPFPVIYYRVGPAIVEGSCGTTFCSSYFSGSTFTIRWDLVVPRTVDHGEINFTFNPTRTTRPVNDVWYDGVGTATKFSGSGGYVADTVLTLSRIRIHDDGDPLSERFSTPTMRIIASGVPEPTTWAMMAIGFGLLGGLVRRRKMVPLVSFA